MFNEYDNVRNPMLGAYLLWSFVLGYFSEKNEATPLEELFIVLPMTLKEDIAEQIKSTNKTSGMRAMSDKFMKTDVLKNDLISSRYTLDGISRFLGKIEYASETIASLESDGELSAEITTLRERIAKLKKIADESVIKMKIENAITKISLKQMELLKLMDAERPDDPFRLDYKNLTVEVDGEDGRKDYLWEIGSGSNWLAYHISTILGLQEYFSTFQSSVPNFVVFDQPSQVYFPHSSADGGEVHDLGDLDREAVKSIFTTMAKCISNVNDNMQILVLEHADSSIYGDVQGINEVCVWRDGEKLIPFEWIG